MADKDVVLVVGRRKKGAMGSVRRQCSLMHRMKAPKDTVGIRQPIRNGHSTVNCRYLEKP